MRHRLFSRENAVVAFVCLVIILIIIVTADDAPLWIYQAF